MSECPKCPNPLLTRSIFQYGDYVVYRSQYRGVTPLEGIANATSGKATYAQGCQRWDGYEVTEGFPAAVAAAQAADVAVVVVGTWSRDQQELWEGLNATTGEHVDESSLKLVGAMGPLVKAIIDTGKPTVVVYQSGKPITEPWISRNAGALVQQFYPSEQGGNALADILFGDVNPSGKLSVSFPYDVGTLPVYYDYLNSGRAITDSGRIFPNGSIAFGHQYVTNTPNPLYEFGFGRSYTTFAYADVTLSQATAPANSNGQVTASVAVTNSGTVDGQEVVQLYVSDVIASVDVPHLQLKGFQKVLVQAGQTQTVHIPVNIQDLGLWNINMDYVVEPGDFVFYAAASSLDLRGNATLTLT